MNLKLLKTFSSTNDPSVTPEIEPKVEPEVETDSTKKDEKFGINDLSTNDLPNLGDDLQTGQNQPVSQLSHEESPVESPVEPLEPVKVGFAQRLKFTKL